MKYSKVGQQCYSNKVTILLEIILYVVNTRYERNLKLQLSKLRFFKKRSTHLNDNQRIYLRAG